MSDCCNQLTSCIYALVGFGVCFCWCMRLEFMTRNQQKKKEIN